MLELNQSGSGEVFYGHRRSYNCAWNKTPGKLGAWQHRTLFSRFAGEATRKPRPAVGQVTVNDDYVRHHSREHVCTVCSDLRCLNHHGLAHQAISRSRVSASFDQPLLKLQRFRRYSLYSQYLLQQNISLSSLSPAKMISNILRRLQGGNLEVFKVSPAFI